MVPSVDQVLIDQRRAHRRVPHALHQLTRARAARRRQGVARVSEIVKMHVFEPGRVDGA